VGIRCKCTQKSGSCLNHFGRVLLEHVNMFCSNVLFPYRMDENSNLNDMLNQTADQNEQVMRSCIYLLSCLFCHGQKCGIQN